MKYYYRAAPELLNSLVGSLYFMEMPEAAGDLVRVEIPHIRFLCRGVSTLSTGDEMREFASPEILVCGPSFHTGQVQVTPGTRIIGASLTPEGWARLVGCPADQMANQKTGISDLRHELDIEAVLKGLMHLDQDEDLFDVVENFLVEAVLKDIAIRHEFLEIADSWIADPDAPGVGALVERTGLSARQIDRLCRQYFGGSPKQVHRVFRALNISYRLTTEPHIETRDIVGPYFDQSHLIRDFKSRIGCTPEDFRAERLFMMRFDLEQRLKIPDISHYALIG